MQLTLSQIPSNINTVERLAAWCAMVLDANAGTLQVLESDNAYPSYAAQTQIIRAADETIRLICRYSLILNPAYTSDTTKKLWMHVSDLVNTTPSTGFTTN